MGPFHTSRSILSDSSKRIVAQICKACRFHKPQDRTAERAPRRPSGSVSFAEIPGEPRLHWPLDMVPTLGRSYGMKCRRTELAFGTVSGYPQKGLRGYRPPIQSSQPARPSAGRSNGQWRPARTDQPPGASADRKICRQRRRHYGCSAPEPLPPQPPEPRTPPSNRLQFIAAVCHYRKTIGPNNDLNDRVYLEAGRARCLFRRVFAVDVCDTRQRQRTGSEGGIPSVGCGL